MFYNSTFVRARNQRSYAADNGPRQEPERKLTTSNLNLTLFMLSYSFWNFNYLIIVWNCVDSFSTRPYVPMLPDSSKIDIPCHVSTLCHL